MSKIAEQLLKSGPRDPLTPVKNPGDDPGSEVASTTAVTNESPSNLLAENKSRSSKMAEGDVDDIDAMLEESYQKKEVH